jgi:TfoX N-terminal domain
MSPKKAAPAAAADKVALYEKVVATQPEVERKGATMPYTSLNGNMFSFLEADGTMVLRLGAAEREQFIDHFKTQLHHARGIVQKEYVDVPDALLRDTAQLSRYFAQSYEYAKSLKPKPTTRKT